LLQITGPDHKENSLENASETMSTNSASSPVPFVHNHSSEANDTDKRRHKSSSDDSKVHDTVFRSTVECTPRQGGQIFLYAKYQNGKNTK
jgi:hypothetical protein